MIRIAITPAAFEAIAATLPLGPVAVEPQTDANGERLIWLDPAVVDPPVPARPGRELQRRDLAAGEGGGLRAVQCVT
jgi:hypothetical protein